MKAINTIPRDEYAERLFKAMQRISKKIIRLSDEEDYLGMTADNQGDEEGALKHAFNSIALSMVRQRIVISLERLEEVLNGEK